MGFVLGRISIMRASQCQQMTVGHNETLNKHTRTQSFPRTKAKPRPCTQSVFLDRRVCCTCVLRLCVFRVVVCAVFGLIRSRGKDHAVSSKARRQATHRVEDTVPLPVKPSGHSRWTDPERCWLGFREQPPESPTFACSAGKFQSELKTFDYRFLVTDANDTKKHVAPELLSGVYSWKMFWPSAPWWSLLGHS